MQHTTGAGKAIESAREEAGVPQNEVAGWLGISRATYWRRITGRAEFTGAEVRKIRRHLGIDIAELL